MSISVSICDSVASISMSGRFDFHVHREFKEAYSALLVNADVCEIEIEMSQVDYLDSSALGMLILLNERAKEAKKSIILLSPSSVVAQVLDVANFSKIFNIKHAI